MINQETPTRLRIIALCLAVAVFAILIFLLRSGSPPIAASGHDAQPPAAIDQAGPPLVGAPVAPTVPKSANDAGPIAAPGAALTGTLAVTVRASSADSPAPLGRLRVSVADQVTESKSSVFTDESGLALLALPVGQYLVYLDEAGYSYEAVQASVSPGNTEHVTIQLVRGGDVHLCAVDAARHPVARPFMDLGLSVPVRADDAGCLSVRLPLGARVASAMLSAVIDGEPHIVATGTSSFSVAEDVVTEVAVIVRGGALWIEALCPGGPCAEVQAVITSPVGEVHDTRGDSKGILATGIAAGPVVIDVRDFSLPGTPLFGEASATVTDAMTTRVSMDLQPATLGRLSGAGSAEDGSPAPAARVIANSHGFSVSGSTSVDGKFELDGLIDGRCEVGVSLGGPRGFLWTQTVCPGTVAIALPPR